MQLLDLANLKSESVMAARPVVRSMNPGPAPRPGPDRLVTDTPNTALQIESVGALKFFPRVKLHEPAVALPVSSDRHEW